MISITVAGNVGRDAELRDYNGTPVLNFSVAANSGFGERQQTVWFGCSIWGKRGETLAQYITKGNQVTVVGELSFREHENKQYQEIRVSDIKLQGGRQDGAGATPQATAPQQQPQQAQQPAGGSVSFDDDVPF